jgi:CRP-like cAMP-binding protein
MIDLLILKLDRRDPLSEEEKNVLRASVTRTDQFEPDADLVREGDRPTESCLLLEGFAARYKLMQDGRRQITAIHIAGDFVDLHSFLLKTMDHGVVTLSSASVAYVPHTNLVRITREEPHLARMLWLNTLMDAAIHRQWLTAMGRSSATAHLAHLICELHWRLAEVGLTDGSSFRIPMTQEELGDTLGLSTVHVNRVLSELRTGGLVKWQHNAVTILNREGLVETAQFSPLYLCPGSEPR